MKKVSKRTLAIASATAVVATGTGGEVFEGLTG
jgi:hypothetical protein